MRGRSIASPTSSPWPTTLFTIWRIAPRSRTEPALPTTSRGSSSRSTMDGAIMLVRRMPGHGLTATRSYSPSMLFRCTPVPGTITPDPAPVDAVFGEVALVDLAAVLADVGRDGASDLAVVELARAALGDPLERAREVGHREPVARDEALAVPLVDPPALVGVAEYQVEDRVQVRLRARELDSLACELDSGRDELRPRLRPVRAVRSLEAGRRARDADRRGADVEDL